MMKLIARAALVVIAGTTLGAAALEEKTPVTVPLEEAGYERAGGEHGVRVYRYRNAKEIRVAAEGELPVPPAKVRDLLLDYPHHVGQIPRLADSRVLQREGHSLL